MRIRLTKRGAHLSVSLLSSYSFLLLGSSSSHSLFFLSLSLSILPPLLSFSKCTRRERGSGGGRVKARAGGAAECDAGLAAGWRKAMAHGVGDGAKAHQGARPCVSD